MDKISLIAVILIPLAKGLITQGGPQGQRSTASGGCFFRAVT